MISLPAVKKTTGDCPAFRISPSDTNYFALVFDQTAENCDFVAVVEIFQPGGKTPPNVHQVAHEMFFVLEGSGKAYVDGRATSLKKGDALLVRPGSTHEVENTGTGKLYCLTVMTPDEHFAALIRAGQAVKLDDDDRLVLGGLG
ncbi:cupin domain-containing protein [Paraburkholderia sp. MM5482-R1]|uniref:cupin domain-containing protein n=1 Tax=unclassified Paraburkholderia TaxID=2615204 RepID=UPI003D22810E